MEFTTRQICDRALKLYEIQPGAGNYIYYRVSEGKSKRGADYQIMITMVVGCEMRDRIVDTASSPNEAERKALDLINLNRGFMGEPPLPHFPEAS